METLKQMLIRHEGKKLIPYRCRSGFLTVGIGHNIDANGLPNDVRNYMRQNGKITEEMVNKLYDIDIKKATEGCKELYPNFENFSEVRQMALIDFVFNVGEATAKKFISTNHYINSGDWENAAKRLEKSLWYKQVGKRSKEIVGMIRNG